MKVLNLFLLFFFTTLSSVVAYNYELSDKLDISQAGWDKILQVSNGNTMLFHFEARKPIVVKVFGPDRKEVGGHRFIGKLVDVVALENSELHGIYEINGEAVIFISQAINNKNTLVALRFNTQTGKLIKEQELATSPSFNRKNDYSLVRNTVNGGYAVFCMRDLRAAKEETLSMLVFDEQHNMVREVMMSLDTKEYDYVKHISTCVGSDGTIAVTLDCIKIIHYPDENDHYFAVCYLPVDATAFSNVTTRLPQKIGPYYSAYTYNDFGSTLNMFLVNATTLEVKNGLETLWDVRYTPFMLRYSKANLADMKFTPIVHDMARKQLGEEVDDPGKADLVPIRIYTNKFGMNTVISEENNIGVRFPNGSDVGTFIGNIAVTQMSDEGKEVWSATMPKMQFLLRSLTAKELSERGTHTYLFRRSDPTSDWLYQFASFYPIMTPKGDCYIIYNDKQSNFNRSVSEEIEPVSSYTDNTNITHTNAVCYKITRKKELTKHYLLDDAPDAASPGAVMLEGADYNDKANTFSSVVCQWEDGKSVLKMSWVKLDD